MIAVTSFSLLALGVVVGFGAVMIIMGRRDRDDLEDGGR